VVANVRTKFPELLRKCRDERGISGPIAHVGAHDGEEVPLYREAGVRDEDIYLIEPIPEKAEALRAKYPNAHVIQAACSNFDAKATLNIGERTNQSSLNKHPADRVSRTIEVEVKPLRLLVPDAVIAVIDAQGHEFEVMTMMPQSVRLIVVETSPVEDVSLASEFEDVDFLARSMGFTKAEEWKRDYAWLFKWCRGTAAPADASGDVLDVVYVR